MEEDGNNEEKVILSQKEQSVLRDIGLSDIFSGLCLLIVGILGICFGFYSIIYGQMSEGEFQLTIVLIGFSVGFIHFGCRYYRGMKLLKKFKFFLERDCDKQESGSKGG